MAFHDNWKQLPVDILTLLAFNLLGAFFFSCMIRSVYILVPWMVLPAFHLVFGGLKRKNLNHPDFPDNWPERLITPYGVVLGLIHLVVVWLLWIGRRELITLLVWVQRHTPLGKF
jgi:hypothetical protein